MKNQNNQFKSRGAVLIPLLIVCFAAVLAPTLAVARDEVFNGIVSGHNLSQSCANCCDPTILVFNSGGANNLGVFTGTAEFFPRPCAPNPNLCENNIPYTGTFNWFSADGDEIRGTFEGYACPTETPGVYENHETGEVTGGTGRFAHATGHVDLTGQLDFTTSPPSFFAPWQGTIRLRGH